MTNLTPSEARRLIDKLHHNQTKEHGISILEEKYLAALEIALTVLEQTKGWIFEPCENEPCVNGAIVNIHGADIHLCADCSRDKKYSRMKITALPKRLSIAPQPSTTPQIDNDGWIEWGGGEMPTSSDCIVEVKFRDVDCQMEQEVFDFDWHHYGNASDIIAYRVIENDGSK